ncbi:MAG TPA: hypothetical protein VFP06_13165 [Acidimicrobiales bacterium]|nr:hypothetical protein [Acidimicrobiales bacterium]
MVDPVTLAAAAVAILAPFLRRVTEQTADNVSEAISDAAVPAAKRLYQAVRARLRPGSYAANQLDGVEERPDSESRQQALQAALAEELEADPSFAAELEALVTEAQAAGVQITARDTGAVAGRDVHQRGRYVAGRDLNIGDPPDER